MIPSLPLALFVLMLPKAHLTWHSGMSGSRWVIMPSWLTDNKSCLEICSSRLVPLITQQQYISSREVAQNLFSLANLVLKLSQDVCLGKGSDGTLTTLRYSFYLFSASSRKVYNAPLKLVRGLLSCPLLMSMSEAFSITLNKNLHKTLSDWDSLWSQS